ncbi:MAG: hypothetical protein NTV16_06690 [Actinobacteria bacterium]|nr:hypothetical protein [Actinomycetota bacterium]
MDISAIRKKIYLLEQQRQQLILSLLNPKDMIAGSLYVTYKKCGNKRCRCAKGELHGPFNYISKKIDGKTVLTFIRKADEKEIIRQAGHYRDYIKEMAKLNRIDKRIYDSIKKIKQAKTKNYERPKKV